MDKRTGRRVHLSFSGRETKITLAWFDEDNEGKRGFITKDLSFVKDGVTRSVEKSLDMLVPHWNKVFVSEHSHAIVSCEIDKDPELFDAITQAEEPEQYFVSRYTLEYCGGKTATERIAEIEFNEKYAELIAFNRRAIAKV